MTRQSMEWGLGRFDAFVPAFPEASPSHPFPRSSTPEALYLLPLGIDQHAFVIRGIRYPLGTASISATAGYLVCTQQEATLAQQHADAPLRLVILEEFIAGIALPKGVLSATDQDAWLTAYLPQLQNTWRCDPSRFPTSQAAWRHHAIRRMGRDWKSVDTAQNAFWFTHPHAPLSEAFLLTENRPNRTVVACDLRSAYGWAIATQAYPDPGSWHPSITPPLSGVPFLALCRLSKPTAWLSRHHPWMYAEHGQKLPFYWSTEDTVAGWFTDFELAAVAGLCQIDVLEYRVSAHTGPHPLASQVTHWFTQRLTDPDQAMAWKIKIASAHSWTVHYQVGTVPAGLVDEVLAERMVARRFIKDKRVFYERRDPELGYIPYAHIGAEAGVWLPSVWTALLVRTRTFSLMRWAHERHPDVDCAYVNVDAVHWSMPAAYKDVFLSSLQDSPWYGNQMGEVKVEAIADRGSWLRPGSYVLWGADKPMISTLGEQPWSVHRQQAGFWDRDWQTMFGLAGSVRHSWYQRPSDTVAWTEPGKYLTQNLIKTARFKQACWLRTCDTLARQYRSTC